MFDFPLKRCGSLAMNFQTQMFHNLVNFFLKILCLRMQDDLLKRETRFWMWAEPKRYLCIYSYSLRAGNSEGKRKSPRRSSEKRAFKQ